MTAAEARDQKLGALAAANGVRFANAELKAAVHAGKVRASTVLREAPESAARIKVRDLLLAVLSVGPEKARRFMRRANVSSDAYLGELTERQRLVLADEVAVHEVKSKLLAAIGAGEHGLPPAEVDEHVEAVARVTVDARGAA